MDKDTDILADLQTRLAFQDHTIAELNDVITDQQKQIDRLEQRLKLLTDKVQGLEDAVTVGGGKAQHEKPPHY